MEEKKSQKSLKNFGCEICHYFTSSKKDFDKHLLTSKHKKNENGSIQEEKQIQIYNCDCGKICKTHGGIWKHKQKCIILQSLSTEKNDEEKNDYEEIIKYLIKENSEFKQMLIDQNKQIIELSKNSSNYNINNNSHNKTFNLQFFLNETCKDAMNIMDFVDSIKLQLSDLEKLGKNGFVEGISNIIIKNLNSLDETKRPVHCTDSKREVMYVKDENKWEKENDTKMKLRRAIKKVAHKNTMMLSEFRNKHPDCLKSESKVSDQYNKLVFEAMGGKGDNDSEKEDKIIKNIAKEVTIDKVL
jgi:hypothetical protein